MVLCGEECEPCCDFCIYEISDIWEENGITIKGGPIGCKLHPDEKHQMLAEDCSYCEDFHCFRA